MLSQQDAQKHDDALYLNKILSWFQLSYLLLIMYESNIRHLNNVDWRLLRLFFNHLLSKVFGRKQENNMILLDRSALRDI